MRVFFANNTEKADNVFGRGSRRDAGALRARRKNKGRKRMGNEQ